MRVINYSEFRSNMANSLNAVTDNSEIVVVSRSGGKNVVLISLDEYNGIQETLYLTGSNANRKRLDSAIAEMETGKFSKHKLIGK